MAVSKANQRAVNKYKKNNYDRMEVFVPKGRKDDVKAHATAHGESVNGFIGRAISETMDRDGGGAAAPGAFPLEQDGVEMPTGEPQEAAGWRVGAGVVSLPPDVLEAAQRAAEAAGEAVPDFVRRAVETQAQRDRLGRSMELGTAR